jgi:hypothetical protein
MGFREPEKLGLRRCVPVCRVLEGISVWVLFFCSSHGVQIWMSLFGSGDLSENFIW